MRDLIAISGKQYAGKDLFADLLLQELQDYHKVPLAKAIKDEFAAIYGLTPHDIEADKATFRPGLIALGQRRRQQDPDYWIKRVLKTPGSKIVSDMRMRREYDFFREYSAFCIRLETDRPIRQERGTLVKEDDITECDLDNVTDWDLIVRNNGTLADLQEQARQLAIRLKQE